MRYFFIILLINIVLFNFQTTQEVKYYKSKIYSYNFTKFPKLFTLYPYFYRVWSCAVYAWKAPNKIKQIKIQIAVHTCFECVSSKLSSTQIEYFQTLNSDCTEFLVKHKSKIQFCYGGMNKVLLFFHVLWMF